MFVKRLETVCVCVCVCVICLIMWRQLYIYNAVQFDTYIIIFSNRSILPAVEFSYQYRFIRLPVGNNHQAKLNQNVFIAYRSVILYSLYIHIVCVLHLQNLRDNKDGRSELGPSGHFPGERVARQNLSLFYCKNVPSPPFVEPIPRYITKYYFQIL